MKKLMAGLLLIYTVPVLGMSWQDLWLRPDQQAKRLLDKNQPQQAAKIFVDPKWQAVANYRAGDYAQAAQQFAKLPSAAADYNRGNALALQKDYQAAIAAYDAALKKNPHHQDASYNREVIKKLLQQQDQAQSAQQQKASSQPSSEPQAENQPDKTAQDSSKPEPKENATAKKAPSQNAAEKPQHTQPKAAAKTAAKAPESAPQNKAELIEKPTQQQEANEQWLRQIPDDPGGLLRQKFLRDHQRRGSE